MLFMKKHFDYVIVGVLVIWVGIVPFIKFIDNYLYWVNSYSSMEMELIEFWDYSFWSIEGTWIMMLSPVIIILFTSYKFFSNVKEYSLIKEEYVEADFKSIKKLVLKEWIKSSLLLLSYSFMIFITALILPTSRTPVGAMNIDESIKLLIYFHINLVLYSIVITNIGLITVRFTRKYIFTFLISVLGFIVLTLGLSAIGAIIDVAIEGNINMDWFMIYNTLQFDSGMPYIFGTALLMILFATTTTVLYLVYKGNKDLEE